MPLAYLHNVFARRCRALIENISPSWGRCSRSRRLLNKQEHIGDYCHTITYFENSWSLMIALQKTQPSLAARSVAWLRKWNACVVSVYNHTWRTVSHKDAGRWHNLCHRPVRSARDLWPFALLRLGDLLDSCGFLPVAQTRIFQFGCPRRREGHDIIHVFAKFANKARPCHIVLARPCQIVFSDQPDFVLYLHMCIYVCNYIYIYIRTHNVSIFTTCLRGRRQSRRRSFW